MTFLSVYQTNLDEFFMVRVGSLEDMKLLDEETRENKTNMTPQEQIDAILKRVKVLNDEKDAVYDHVMKLVKDAGVRLVSFRDMDRAESKSLEAYFIKEVLPLLSVMIVGRKQSFPFLKGQEIYALAILDTKGGKEKIGIIPCTNEMLPRLIAVPGRENTYILLEELILHFLPNTFKGYKVQEKSVLRVTRNADIDVTKVYDEDLNYRDQMAQVVKLRKKLAPVRLELTKNQVFFSKAPLELSFLFQIEDALRKNPKLVFPKRLPQQTDELDPMEPILPQVLQKDVLLSYPYESIRPFLQILQEAAEDPKVVSIRMTLYRLAKNSKVVEALAEAAENGKQVDVLVELKARFDEENNIEWSRRLEDAGCHVVYGIDGLKVHSKLCLITRKDGDQIQYITQIGTGNYNEKTARLYTDLSLITANQEIGEEALKVFQAILLGKTVNDTEHLLVAPKCLQKPVLGLIDREIQMAKEGKAAYIGIKINSLTDKRIIDKLVEASKAGVKIDMVVRGICCLRSGVLGETEHIHIRSIVGRYLEHSRIYIFGIEDRDQIYIASADFMTRNTLRRVEVAVPVYDEKLKCRIREMFQAMLKDNVKARVQQPDGTYRIEESEEAPFNSQEAFFEEAYRRAAKNQEEPSETKQ